MPETLILPVIPLRSGVVLPGMLFTIGLETEEAKAAAAVVPDGGSLLLVPHIEGRYGTVAVIADVLERGEMQGGLPALAVSGRSRALLGTGVPGTGDALWVEAEQVDETSSDEARTTELAREYRAVLENILLSRGARRIAGQLREITDPGRLADVAGYSPDLSLEQKVQVLETLDVTERLSMVLGWAKDTLADLALRERIKTDVAEGMERSQREFLLRRQLEEIRKELGELGGAEPGEAADYRERLENLVVRDEVRTAIEREITKLERTSEQSPEQGWIRTWLDTIFEVPWGVESEDRLDLKEAASMLDADHDGLSDVKERILQHLAVRKLRSERNMTAVQGRGSGAILALVGPPGVGKTSLGASVARALGRSFVRVALGGVRDEAEIRGHRRTYVGAQPGRLVRALREAGTMNPVILLDEVDKLGADFRGDPSSALLEVLDPAQNHTFRDHYLEVDLDLSQVMFIATANVIDTVPAALFDRMETISLDGYTDTEKLAIARHHLLGRQLERAGLKQDEVVVQDAAISVVISDYTREAGVRSLERELGRLTRKIATRLVAAELDPPVVVSGQDVGGWLGRPRFFFEAKEREPLSGVATGLAVTGAGGDVLFVEASASPGPEGLTLTGQLGEVMKESAEIALSLVRSRAAELGIEPGELAGRRFHVHVPAGAVPKDGPSAGVTMVSALVSLLTKTPLRPAVGMTGEVTLRGRVLPIGGVRQKVLAAHRHGLSQVILPARNSGDLEDVPQEVRDEMEFHLVETIDEVLAVALGEPEASGRSPASAAA
ncbi:MAG: endopeptidase La [Acidimicrobiales bacterium]